MTGIDLVTELIRKSCILQLLTMYTNARSNNNNNNNNRIYFVSMVTVKNSHWLIKIDNLKNNILVIKLK